MQRAVRVLVATGVAAAATAVVTQVPASAYTGARHQHSQHSLPVSLVRYMRAHPGGNLLAVPMVMTPVRPKGGAHAANTVSGNCGQSFLYINNAPGIGHGWIQEYAGVSLNWPITGGGGLISWSNSTTGGHNAYNWGFGFDINGNASLTRNAYTRVGWIYAVMSASALMITPFGPVACHTPTGQPYSFTYAS